MYLKSLKLVGFKSFADRTRLELRPGVTVVVGPNGSGKSNIVDAVAWVMGTQSPKSLRTDKMDDVIFAGTATRPGLGRAEVTLVLDNASGMLALDLPEVAITRRLYRDGSSDYEINGVSCRLLDIQELLSDSHVGRHQHVIIGQGQIETVLNAGPEDHRAVIEEAAGILKHRIRKDKAMRRLERTDADVLRLRDLLTEMSRQIRPLKRQADAALRHGDLAAEVRSLRLFLSGEMLRGYRARLEAIMAAEVGLRQAIADGEATSSALGGQMAELRLAAGDVGEALDRDTSAAARLETTIERLRRIGQVAQERHRAGEARRAGAADRRRDLAAEFEELELASDKERVILVDVERRVADTERRFRQAEAEERSLADQEGMSVEGAIAVVRGDLRALEAADERDERERMGLARRDDAMRAQIENEVGQAKAFNAEIQAIDARVWEAQAAYQATEAARRSLQNEWEQAEADQREAELATAAAVARCVALEQAAAGLSDPESRRMAEAAQGAVDSVSRRLDVPAHLAGAVDGALGPWSDAVVFDQAESARQAVSHLKGAGRGGIPILHAVAGPGLAIAREVAATWGLEALVDGLGVGADQALAVQLLGDVVLVEGWAAGWSVVASDSRVRAVTPEGDLLTAGGVRVAVPNGATPAVLELALVDRERAEIRSARASSVLVSVKRVFEDARQAERKSLEVLEGLEAKLAGTTEALGRLDRSVASFREEQTRTQERLRSVVAAIQERTEQRAGLTDRLSSLEGEEAERQRVWDELSENRRLASERREVARAAWQEAVVAQRGLTERLSMADARKVEVERSLGLDEEAPVEERHLERLLAISEQARLALEACRIHLDALRARQATLRQQAGAAGLELGALQDQRDGLARVAEAAGQSLNANAIESTELRVRSEAIEEGLRRDLDVDAAAAMATPVPDTGTDNLAERLSTREAELRRMGPVNPLAASEYAELEERRQFMSDQLDDLEGSRSELRKVIKALDVEIEGQFLAAYNEIAQAFTDHFSVLFPGGSGRLRLTTPDDALTTGVEIEAQPLGKKVAKMSLLSGGERSLAALAFLFSVFKARPSPFYILDEVEAALDNANLRRFLRLLDRFRADAQLMVITHQQQTMESADVLYGVTMEPGGSSKVVAKSMSESAILSSQSTR